MLPDKLWYLKKIDFFKGLNDAEYDLIDRDSKALMVRKRESLPYYGTAKLFVYFVKKGKMKLLKISPAGHSLILDILGEGTLFGEIEPEHRTDDEDIIAEAMEDTLLCMMQRDNFDRLIRLIPALSIRIIKFTGFRLKKIQNRLVDMLYCSVKVRLAKTFLNLADEFGVPKPDGLVINLKLTHNDLASLIASTRETVSAAIKEFRNQELIECKNHCFVLLNEERLAKLANGEE